VLGSACLPRVPDQQSAKLHALGHPAGFEFALGKTPRDLAESPRDAFGDHVSWRS
jgi:hypothetical protein